MKKNTHKSLILEASQLHLKKIPWRVLVCTTFLLTSFQSIFSHGTVTSPASRVYICYQENPENPDTPACIAAVASHGTQALYDWPAILQPNANGNHRSLLMDGNLASGGNPVKYGGMDQVRDDWVTTPVSPGPYNITWTITAQHATLYYEVYITKADWAPDQPLSWDSLELLVRTGEMPLSTEDIIPVTLPERTGKHIIFSIWQRSLSPEAFYSTSDVDFGQPLSIEDIEKPASLLKQNYPNPFSKTSTIQYNLKEETLVNLKIYNLLGQEVLTLENNSIKSAGKHETIFDLENTEDGVYLYVLKTAYSIESRRMVLKK